MHNPSAKGLLMLKNWVVIAGTAGWPSPEYAIMGIELKDCGRYVKLYIQLDFTEYEEYYVIMTDDGHLSVSDIVMWNDDVCCTSYIDINTGEASDEESIFKLE